MAELTTDLYVKNYATCTGALLEFTSLISSGEIVQFNAFLTEFDQSFASQWNTEEVFGRMDPIASFKNTKRTVSLGWNIPASTSDEAKQTLEKISKLTKMLYPAYSAEQQTTDNEDQGGGGGSQGKQSKKITRPSQITLATAPHTQTLSKPPLVKIKYANLLNGLNGDGQLGWIESLSVRPVLDMGFFIDNKNMYPKVVQMSCSFSVLHQQNVGHTQNGSWMGLDSFPFYKVK